ncbi:hypothetical protein [Roseobacter sp.]
MPAKTAPAPSRPNCLGCPDCKGLCHDLLQLAGLPDAILRSAGNS